MARSQTGQGGARRVLGPFNRVEGDLEVRLTVEDGHVRRAEVNAPLFRGFEPMLEGRAPEDALTLVPRICGICSVSQSMAAARAIAAAAGQGPTPQGALVAALIHAVENAADHLFHFNLFFMADFARPAYADRAWARAVEARFLPQRGEAVRAAVAARAQLMHVLGMLAGRWPHTLAVQPGGVTRAPGLRERLRILAELTAFRRHLESALFGAPPEAFVALETVPDLLAWEGGDAGLFLRIAADLDLAHLGPGGGRYLSFGGYALADRTIFAPGLWEGGVPAPVDPGAITEDLSHAWMRGATAHPFAGMTLPDPEMAAPGYSWCKAPRLAGRPVEVGALARQVIDGHPLARDLARDGGVLARVAGRLLELARLIGVMEDLARAITPEAAFMTPVTPPEDGTGAGLVEAARGSLGHWLRIERGHIAGYQIIAPTTWNFSPRDACGVPGPLEAALEGIALADADGTDTGTPLAVQHVVRSFDPCMVCTVH
ncbi:nickel-dependent hydrogenase large subunit [Phaeovulum vinaykumarii]|uniref:Hydrogenase large subunit n=1 Tax=Phaeovulum vinaykumarii TaxID=407234 RepID=A0A1N7LA54_9RHOB|nr:nickel-dependent hydrogenase large subunit [Phaeovulum vinaykumarii]SIS70590.1 hydrogenase large subunit [Phaeovulum vinaykumarii]SOB98816.1 hydrogenase large subunit [Phaeovulum vinaykumarii]